MPRSVAWPPRLDHRVAPTGLSKYAWCWWSDAHCPVDPRSGQSGLFRSTPIMCRTAGAQEGRRKTEDGRRKTEDGTTCHQRSWLDALFRATTGRCGCLHCPTTSWRCALCTPYEYVPGLVLSSCGPQVQFEANWTADYDLSQVPFSGSMAVQNFSMGSVSSPCLSGHDTPDHLLVIRSDVRIVFQHLPVHTIIPVILSYSVLYVRYPSL